MIIVTGNSIQGILKEIASAVSGVDTPSWGEDLHREVVMALNGGVDVDTLTFEQAVRRLIEEVKSSRKSGSGKVIEPVGSVRVDYASKVPVFTWTRVAELPPGVHDIYIERPSEEALREMYIFLKQQVKDLGSELANAQGELGEMKKLLAAKEQELNEIKTGAMIASVGDYQHEHGGESLMPSALPVARGESPSDEDWLI